MPATYISVDDVAPRAGGRQLTATSSPSLSDVEGWAIQAEAELRGTLRSVGITTTYAEGSDGFAIIKGWGETFIEGRLRMSHAAAGGDGSNVDGQKLYDQWYERLKEIVQDPARFAAMLGASTAASEPLGIGSHVTSTRLNLPRSELDPVFQRGRENF